MNIDDFQYWFRKSILNINLKKHLLPACCLLITSFFSLLSSRFLALFKGSNINSQLFKQKLQEIEGPPFPSLGLAVSFYNFPIFQYEYMQ